MLSPRSDCPKKLPISARQIGVKRKIRSPASAGARNAKGTHRLACIVERFPTAGSTFVLRDLAIDLHGGRREHVLDVAARLHVAQRDAQDVLVFAESGR